MQVKFIGTVEITNTINDSVGRRYEVFETKEQLDDWVSEIRIEEDAWNKDPSVRSIRWYDIKTYSADDFMDLDLYEFRLMKLRDFVSIIAKILASNNP